MFVQRHKPVHLTGEADGRRAAVRAELPHERADAVKPGVAQHAGGCS